ncbi:DUF2334 domain-containing protein [Pseudoalteromonas sp. NEC-BIFX-2020_002]|uniref:DUF2334 domain-containing protein n=1 Tax=Pseudoalteromonas sp. NEC-BIFX-2020_002 TaxID=2732353 RepID=UPI00147732BE|nr:DUF2334 domain-containing protein [Pseudoalteromonas sp. NEC-BIFX-2020_002]NNG45147.1 DUF2334 domain-containing protein [Pseudoalteromonas sp. NEC-BIFX-2020_002]
MKFAIRDDDVNYHFSEQLLSDCLDGVSDICPVTLSVVPWYKGDWKKNLELLESVGSAGITDEVIKQIKLDKDIYHIDRNHGLMEYLTHEIKVGRIAIAQHGIYHQNDDLVIPRFSKNFGVGAEFYTDRDLSKELATSNQYLNDLFAGRVCFFTPPQNLLSEQGLDALYVNGLNVCGYLPSAKNYGLFSKYFSTVSFLKVFKHQLFNRKTKRPYPYAIKFGKGHFIEHVSLQPSSSLNEIKDAIDFVFKKRGDFVLSTHTYAFGQKMTGSNETMKDTVINILNYVRDRYEVNFVTMNEILR